MNDSLFEKIHLFFVNKIESARLIKFNRKLCQKYIFT
jgi:hypothetical protein